MATDTGTREPGAAGTQLSPKECGERWGHYGNRSRPLIRQRKLFRALRLAGKVRISSEL